MDTSGLVPNKTFVNSNFFFSRSVLPCSGERKTKTKNPKTKITQKKQKQTEIMLNDTRQSSQGQVSEHVTPLEEKKTATPYGWRSNEWKLSPLG